MPPSVHAIVLNRDGRQWLPRCLGTLLACSYPRLKILLVDNGSVDDSVALARGISPDIEIIENSSNQGFCEGNNRGIRRALDRGADYIALLNNDTYFESDWLDHVISIGEADPGIGILGPVQLVFDGEDLNDWTTSALPHLVEKLRERRPGVWFPVEWVEGSCLVGKRGVFERVGLLDPIFSSFFEEMDLCRRARAAGFRIAIVPAARIHHYRGASFGQPGLAAHRAFLLSRNSMIYNSTDPAISVPGNLGRLLRNDAVQLRDALFRQGRFLSWLRANGSVLVLLRSLYRKWRSDRRMLGRVQ